MPAADTTPLQTTARGPSFLMLTAPHLFVTVMEGLPTAQSVEEQSQWARGPMGTTPGSVGCVVVLSPTTQPPPPELRDSMPKLLADIIPATAGLAMVVEATGFRGAALRGIFTGFLLIRRLPYRTAVFSSVDQGVKWLAQALPLDVEETTRQIRELRASGGIPEPTN